MNSEAKLTAARADIKRQYDIIWAGYYKLADKTRVHRHGRDWLVYNDDFDFVYSDAWASYKKKQINGDILTQHIVRVAKRGVAMAKLIRDLQDYEFIKGKVPEINVYWMGHA